MIQRPVAGEARDALPTEDAVSPGRLPREAPARKGHWRIGVPYGEDRVLVRRARERNEPLVIRGLPQLPGECLFNAVQRRNMKRTAEA